MTDKSVSDGAQSISCFVLLMAKVIFICLQSPLPIGERVRVRGNFSCSLAILQFIASIQNGLNNRMNVKSHVIICKANYLSTKKFQIFGSCRVVFLLFLF